MPQFIDSNNQYIYSFQWHNWVHFFLTLLSLSLFLSSTPHSTLFTVNYNFSPLIFRPFFLIHLSHFSLLCKKSHIGIDFSFAICYVSIFQNIHDMRHTVSTFCIATSIIIFLEDKWCLLPSYMASSSKALHLNLISIHSIWNERIKKKMWMRYCSYTNNKCKKFSRLFEAYNK